MEIKAKIEEYREYLRKEHTDTDPAVAGIFDRED